jgi:hypothetical protein
MNLKVDVFPLIRPCHIIIETVQKKLFEPSLSKPSKIMYKICEYLKKVNSKYEHIMVVADIYSKEYNFKGIRRSIIPN